MCRWPRLHALLPFSSLPVVLRCLVLFLECCDGAKEASANHTALHLFNGPLPTLPIPSPSPCLECGSARTLFSSLRFSSCFVCVSVPADHTDSIHLRARGPRHFHFHFPFRFLFSSSVSVDSCVRVSGCRRTSPRGEQRVPELTLPIATRAPPRALIVCAGRILSLTSVRRTRAHRTRATGCSAAFLSFKIFVLLSSAAQAASLAAVLSSSSLPPAAAPPERMLVCGCTAEWLVVCDSQKTACESNNAACTQLTCTHGVSSSLSLLRCHQGNKLFFHP